MTSWPLGEDGEDAGRRAKLYFEAHVTLAPVFGAERQRAEEIAGYYQFKLAKLVMLKDQGPDQESRRDTFMTGHGNWLPSIEARLKGLIAHLKREYFTVLRYKVEDTILDSRSEDVWGLLSAPSTPAAPTGSRHESPG